MTPNAVGEVMGASWDDDAIRANADRYSEDQFVGRLRAIALGEQSRTTERVLV
jgi:hypothetical protein